MTAERTLTIDDVFTLENIYDVQLSPDGTQVAYTVSESCTDGEHTSIAAKIWLAGAGGEPHAAQFTFGPRVDSMPRWSPDGRVLAFLSDREKADIQQIFLIPVAGGEARRLTNAKGGVTSLKWGRDGRQIAFLAPDAESDEEERRKKEKDDAEHVDHDYKFTRLWVVDVAGGEPRSITPPELQVRSYAWLGPDAWAITASETPTEDDLGKPWSVRRVAEGIPPETIWQGRHRADSVTSSPDGRWLAWLHDGMDAETCVNEVWVVSPGGEARRLLDDLDGNLNSLGWIPGEEALLLTATSHTQSLLARLPAAGGPPEILLRGRTLLEGFGDTPGVSVSADGRRYACLIEDGTHPLEVWVGELGSEPLRMTRHNPNLAGVTLGRTETIRWSAPDGLEIEGVLIYPADYDPGRRYPLILHYHGGPNWQWREQFMASWHNWGQILAARGYLVLLPNPRGSTGRGTAFAGANRRAWGIGDLPDALAGVDHVVDAGLADSDRLGVGGWSYGGFLTAWTIGHSDRFKAAVVGAAVTDLVSFQASDIPSWLPRAQMLVPPWEDPEIYMQCSPITYAGNITTPALILHGAADPRVPVGQGYELYHALRHRGMPVDMVVYPRETHAINERHHQRDLMTRVGDWFDRHLKGETS